MLDPLVEDAGHLFEAGFMLGVVRAIATLPSPPPALEGYREQRASYAIPHIIDRFVRNVPGVAEKDAGRVLARYYLMKGHISGYTFLQEYLEALTVLKTRARNRERSRASLQIRYWQCSLLGKKRLEVSSENERGIEHARWLEQIGAEPGQLWEADRHTGGFLNADLLLWVQLGHQHDILVVDTSIATAGSRHLKTDLTIGSEFLRMLERDVSHLEEKGAFSRLAIETGTESSALFTPKLATYFTAFASEDKESSKLIQAGGYAHGFYTFIKRIVLLKAEDPVTFHIVGYTGRGISSMVLRADQQHILEACSTIYRESKYGQIELDPAERLEDARRRVFQVLQSKTAALFGEGRAFVKALTERLPAEGTIEHTEILQGTFQNTATLPPAEVLQRYGLSQDTLQSPRNKRAPSTRDAHAALVRQALEAGRRYVFLTGNPGIGKTTTIADYLKNHCHEEGFLFLYASPRKAVNRDIFAKFLAEASDGVDAERPYYSERFLGLSTNATIIRNAGGRATVEYVGKSARVPAQPRGVRFLTSAEVEQQRLDQGTTHLPRRLEQASENILRDKGTQGAGVLKSICTAIGTALGTEQPNALVAAVAIQSLKRNEHGQDTLEHLQEIFGSAYSQRDNRLLTDRMQKLAATTRHLIIMIDEITGDDAGYEFFRRVSLWLRANQFEQYGFRPLMIVSDASITGVEVVRAHFALSQREPDARKIYLTVAPTAQESTATDAISLLPFDFEREGAGDAFLVNSNSYPASALHLRYRVRMAVWDVPEHPTPKELQVLQSAWQLQKGANHAIVQDVCELLKIDPTSRGQIIVYVQDKGRLQAIIEGIKSQRAKVNQPFANGEEYIEIHADNSESERAHIEQEADRDRFAVVFMTSSASRGLTFSKARHILIDVARFNIETNLMEMIQVLYRGRGGDYDQGEKFVTFYLAEQVLAHSGRREASIREGLMGMLTMLSLIKMCVTTRIAGAVTLRQRKVSIIPIGGKSVSGAGRAYHYDVAHFERALLKQMRGSRSNDRVLGTLQSAVARLMDNVEISLPGKPGSYLSMYQSASSEQIERWMTSDELVEDAFVLGNLLLVPIPADRTETKHHFGIAREIAAVMNEQTRQALSSVLNHPKDYSAGVYDGAREFRQLLNELRDAERSQRLEQRGNVQQGYYVVPLAMFVAKEAIASYCQALPENELGETAAEQLRSVLIRYVRDSYPIDTLLPIGSRYSQFPFLVITSHDLRALRAKTFQTGHTLMSREMNLLTLLLSEE